MISRYCLVSQEAEGKYSWVRSLYAPVETADSQHKKFGRARVGDRVDVGIVEWDLRVGNKIALGGICIAMQCTVSAAYALIIELDTSLWPSVEISGLGLQKRPK